MAVASDEASPSILRWDRVVRLPSHPIGDWGAEFLAPGPNAARQGSGIPLFAVSVPQPALCSQAVSDLLA